MGRRSRRAMAVIAAVTAVTVFAAGCAGGDAGGTSQAVEPSVTISGDTPTPSAEEATPAGIPTAPPPRPEDVRSAKGAKAFARYVVDLLWYAEESHDLEPLFALDVNASCSACRQLRETHREAERKGERNVLARPEKVHDLQIVDAVGPRRSFALRVDLPPGRTVADDGTVTDRYGWERNQYMEIDAKWQDGRWVLQGYQYPEG